ILAVLLRWRREHHKSSLPAERFLSAIRVGLRFVTHTRTLQAVLIRGAAFFVFASATWSLFPLVVRRELGRGPEVYGLLLTCIGIPAALPTAAIGMVAAIGLTWSFRLVDGRAPDFTPSMDWAAPLVAETPEPDSGPVLVTIEYRVDPARRAEFVAAMRDVREMRRRNGAFFWELFHDSAHPTRFLESFMDESWTEHLRQHERVSVSDREVQRRANQFLVKGESTKSTHWLADR